MRWLWRWTQGGLGARRAGDAEKVKMAARLRAESLVTVKWIVERLAMGTPSYLNNRLYRWRKGLLS